MRLHRLFATALLCALFYLPASALQLTSALTTDPIPDPTNPATIQSFQIPSHGAMLNALAYIAEGAGPHPVAILLHGFPGNEKNLDLAQSIRRAGWDVLYFDYRGSWGSPGDFSFTHSLEDTQSAIAFLRDPANAKKLRSDSRSIVLIGHSMGGFMARYVAAQDPAIKGVALISAADMAVDKIESIPAASRGHAVDPIATSFAAEGLAPLAATAHDLADRVRDIRRGIHGACSHARLRWQFRGFAARVSGHLIGPQKLGRGRHLGYPRQAPLLTAGLATFGYPRQALR